MSKHNHRSEILCNVASNLVQKEYEKTGDINKSTLLKAKEITQIAKNIITIDNMIQNNYIKESEFAHIKKVWEQESKTDNASITNTNVDSISKLYDISMKVADFLRKIFTPFGF